ncbi:MAG: nitroreductase family protein [Candidatus Bathyarchaeia archaeon]
MSVLDILKKRRSIRKYQTKPVEVEKITEVLEAARLGPSANNQQPCYFIVITQPEARESLRAAYKADWFVHAPVIIVGCVNPKEGWKRGTFGEEYWKVDLAIAMQNLILAATELGLGTCWIANFDENAVKKALNIPKEIRVVAMTPLGYPDEEKGSVTDRKPLEKIVHYEKW